jgi:hypothetical protein
VDLSQILLDSCPKVDDNGWRGSRTWSSKGPSGKSRLLTCNFKGLRVLDITNTVKPINLGIKKGVGEANSVAASGEYAYVSYNPSDLEIFRIIKQY